MKGSLFKKHGNWYICICQEGKRSRFRSSANSREEAEIELQEELLRRTRAGRLGVAMDNN